MNLPELLLRVQQLRQQAAERIVVGLVGNWEDYQKTLSQIRAYDEVLELTREKKDEREKAKV